MNKVATKEIEALIAQAQGTALTRGGISSLASRLHLEDADLSQVVETLRERLDGRTLAAVLLAHGANGKKLPAKLVGPTLDLLPTITELVAVVGCLEGDLVDMFLCAVESGRLSTQRDAIALWYAAYLSKDGPPDERLVAALRSRLRSKPGIERALLLASAAESIDDAHLKEAAAPYIALMKAKARGKDAVLFELFSSTFEKPVLEVLNEHDVDDAPVHGFTVRRAVEKVGRNDPCPCGSGKKYKKCCQDKDQAQLANPSPVPGVTMDAYLENAHRYMSPSQLGELRPHDIARLPLDEFTTLQLIAAKNKFVLFHLWDQAERALDLLAARDDLPELIDNYRYDLIQEAVSNNEKALFLRQTAHIKDPAVLGDLRVQRALIVPDKESLDVLNARVEADLKSGNAVSTVDMAYWMLDLYPALGIVFARGVLDAERTLDSDMLIDNIEKARDKLLLPPGDPAGEYFDFLLHRSVDRQVERSFEKTQSAQIDALSQKAEALQRELKAATERSATLAQELSTKMRVLETVGKEEKTSAQSTPAPAVAQSNISPSVDPSQTVRLRQKVAKLQSYIEESRAEKSRLRKELAKMGLEIEKLSSSEHVARNEESIDDDDLEENSVLPAFKEPLIPVFEKSATDAMGALQRSVVAQAVRTAAAVAVGDLTGGLKVARMKKITDLWSVRVGIHHRMLFRITDTLPRELRVQHLIHRRDLEAVLRK